MIKPYDSFNDLYKEGEEAAYVRRQQPKSVPAPNKVSGSETRPVFEKKPSLPEHFTARPKRCWRILLVFTACLQVFCAGGLLLGWPVVSSMAAEEGFDAKYVHDVFVFACTANMIAQLVSGWILDRFGPRVCSASCIFQVMVGCLVYGLSPQGDKTCFGVGWALMGFGACGIQTSTFHLSNLFPNRKSTIMAVINSCFILSSIVPGLFVAIGDSMDKDPIESLHHAFSAWAGVLALCTILSIAFYPDSPFVFEECQAIMTPVMNKDNKKKALIKPVLNSRPSVFITNKKINLLRKQLTETHNKQSLSLMGQLTSPEYIFTMLLFLVCSFWFNFFLGTLAMRTQDIFGPKLSSYYVKLFTATYPLSALLNPLVGWLLDVVGFDVGVYLCVLLGLGSAVALAMDHFVVGTLVFIMWSSTIFNFTYSYIAHKFGFSYYGVLIGILFVVAGLANMLQPLLVSLNDWGKVSWIEFASLLVVLLFALLGHWRFFGTCAASFVSLCRNAEDDEEDDEPPMVLQNLGGSGSHPKRSGKVGAGFYESL